MGRKI